MTWPWDERIPENGPAINHCDPRCPLVWPGILRSARARGEFSGGAIGPRERLSSVAFMNRGYLVSAHSLPRNQGVFREVRLLLQVVYRLAGGAILAVLGRGSRSSRSISSSRALLRARLLLLLLTK